LHHQNEGVVREESNEHIAAIRAVHDSAFGRDTEGRLVDRLRSDGIVVTSVVAFDRTTLVANAVFSKLTARTASAALKAAALAPVAVTPPYQRKGFGSSAIAYGLQICAQRGYDAVFVLGDPAYYSRFGFSSETAKTAHSPYSSAGAAWMALELRPCSIRGNAVELHYPDAFSLVD